MIQLVRSIVDPKWVEIQENGVVLQEIEVLFKLWKIPKSFSSQEEVVEWLHKTEHKQAKNRAYRLLSGRSYPSTILKKKLKEAGYAEALCEQLIQELQLLGYIQDEDFWLSFVKAEFRKGNGPRLIELKGKMKGMPVHIVRTHISLEMQREKIKQLEKKGFHSLLRKGFDSDLLIEFFKR